MPLVLVPTSYPRLSFADIAASGKVGLVICGNHAIRAAVAAMRDVFRRILAEGGIPRRFKAAYLTDAQIRAVIATALRRRGHHPAA